jgi:hypothetical protein
MNLILAAVIQFSCYNPISKAGLGLTWNKENGTAHVQFNPELNKILSYQGVEFPEGAYWGTLNETPNGISFSDFQPYAPPTVSRVDVMSHQGGMLVIYHSPTKNATAKYVFEPSDCK